MPGRKEQLQRELKRSAKNCIGLGDYFLKHTKKTAEPQEEVELLKENEDEEVELLEENEDDGTIPGQSSPPKIFYNVQDIRGYTENEYSELANEDEEGINKCESILDMLNDYSLISKPILPANACRINAKSLLPDQPLNFSYPTRYLTIEKDLLKHRSIRNSGSFTSLRRMILRYVTYVCMQTIIKCYYQTKIRKRHS